MSCGAYLKELLRPLGVCLLYTSLSAALNGPGPDGLDVLEFSVGETQFQEDSQIYHCPVEAVCQARLYAVADEGGTFLDFEIRGERL